jgi:hypothetical protein
VGSLLSALFAVGLASAGAASAGAAPPALGTGTFCSPTNICCPAHSSCCSSGCCCDNGGTAWLCLLPRCLAASPRCWEYHHHHVRVLERRRAPLRPVLHEEHLLPRQHMQRHDAVVLLLRLLLLQLLP